MGLEHSPEKTDRQRNARQSADSPPSLAVLRSRRTRAKTSLQIEIDALKKFERIDDSNRLAILSAKSRIDGRVEAIREVCRQASSHPHLPENEVERESEEAETAIEVGILARGIIDGLLAVELFEKAATSSSCQSSSPSIVPSGQQSAAVSGDDVTGQSRIFSRHPSEDSSGGATNTEQSTSVSAGTNCNNPRLYLDTTPEVFDGTVSRYRLWRSQFTNYVHRRTQATDSDKLVAMCKLLSGAPKNLICELPLVDSNFEVALRLLDDNYSVPELRQQEVINNTTRVPIVRNVNDTVRLRELLNDTQRTILALEGVNVPLQSIALTYEQTIRNALPVDLVLNFEDRRTTALLTDDVADVNQAAAAARRLEDLLSFLRRYTVLRERKSSAQQRSTVGDQATPSSADPKVPRYRGLPRRPPGQPPLSTAAATTKNNLNKASKTRRTPCLFCNSFEHLPSCCTADIPMKRRLELLAQRRRCVKCFQYEHLPPRQCSGPRDPCRTCGSSTHHTVMHGHFSGPADSRTTASVLQTVAVATSDRAVVMTATAFVVFGDTKIKVRCFFDSGSMVSFVTRRLIRRLPNIPPKARVDLDLQAFDSQHAVTTNRYDIRLVSAHGDCDPILIQAHEYDFGVDPPTNCSEQMRRLIQHFGATHPLADPSIVNQLDNIAPDLLIGVDQMYKILHLNKETVIAGDLVAKSSRFGWLVSGSYGANTTRGDVIRVQPVCCAATVSKPAKDLERLWSLEAIGAPESAGDHLSLVEQEALQQFRDGISYENRRYTVAMPKRESIERLSNNVEIALQRLSAKRRSLARDPESFQRYDKEIMTFVQAGHAEEIFDVDLAAPSSRDRKFYLPHRQVITRGIDGDKWRIVFDGSSSAAGETSLNSHLLAGPNLNPDILKLLFNFRLRAVALSADIVQAYMTINLAAEDRSWFRFLWQGPGDGRVRCFQFLRVPWGATSSGFLLAAVLREHFERVDPTATYKLGDSFYFDDMLRSFNSEDEAIQFIDKIIPWMLQAGMSLGKWKSSSPTVMDHLSSRSTSPKASATLVETGILKVLGIAWAPAEDHFRFQLSDIDKVSEAEKPITKRQVLRVVASIFDPVGWLIPFTLRGKLLIQQLWSQTLRWDDPLSGPELDSFRRWTQEIPTLSALRIPRLYGDSTRRISGYQLHVFGDASEKAYAGAAYLQTLYVDGGSNCSLLMSKSRVAPREKISLPRLELLAAVLSARLRAFVVERLDVKLDKTTHYTDSAVTYYWCIAEDPTRWKTWVCNRVMEIQKLTSSNEWFHVEGKHNIADIASRGVSAEDLISNSEWFGAPSWLSEPGDRRPVKRLRAGCDETESISKELRLVVTPAVVTPALIDLQRFSGWEKAIRVMANVLRFVQVCRRRDPVPDAELRAQSESLIIRWTQAAHFRNEINATLAQERPARTSKLSLYRLHLDQSGILRAQSRLSASDQFTHDEQNPIIIPGESRLATLLILHHHRLNAHLGVSTILNALRRRFWILRGRQVIKKLIRGCVVCNRAHGPTADQVQPPLPVERASIVAPFATTGVDFCGPFHTRSREGTIKNYIALFTCTSIRAIHLELVPDLTTVQTHLALRRFLAEHPACRKFISDNGRSFVRAAADIRRLFGETRNPQVRELLAQHRIEWTFGCARASWRGGFFERLVGLTKRCLTKTLGRCLISSEEFRTIIRELAATINNRPLSYASNDLDEARALTPAQFLQGGPPASPLCASVPLDALGPNGSIPDAPPGEEKLRQALLERTNYFKSLSSRWQKEYLLLLRSANLDRKGKPRPLKDDSICLLKEDSVSRSKWHLVRILRGKPGRDGAVRTYAIRFSNGFESTRAAQMLIPLEVPNQMDDTLDNEAENL
ncbi:uncharacterized protein LOC100905127 [Galendromus occidentalis]|uniref:Uncharacterized protein LOC100905127 n=1 Tax=Galendromus occidentalis TaxID=34638 RepID=A0AAJ6QQA2_9ACAR|nr:uncharacterized protein LOC100905127 [Galendromus occidentalis]